MIDLFKEEVFPLSTAAKRLPPRRRGKRPAATTLKRWWKTGCGNVFLEVVVVGHTPCTSAEALQRFANALTQNADRGMRSAASQICDTSEQQIERALQDRGL